MWARDGGNHSRDLPDGLSGIFFQEGLDGGARKHASDLPVGQFFCAPVLHGLDRVSSTGLAAGETLRETDMRAVEILIG